MPTPYEDWVQRARDVTIESEILRRGIQLKRQGVERVGPCPRCGGTDRFAINTIKNVFNCRGCAHGGDVIELVEWLDNCQFHEAVETLTHEPKPNGAAGPAQSAPQQAAPGKARWSITATFNYVDEKRTVLFQTVRYEDPAGKKDYSQRRPDGKGGWINDLKGVRLVPFMLPELLADLKASKPIVIVEGEKCVLECRR